MENWTSADIISNDLFFCSSLDFGRNTVIVFICVDLCGVHNNKLLNLLSATGKRLKTINLHNACLASAVPYLYFYFLNIKIIAK